MVVPLLRLKRSAEQRGFRRLLKVRPCALRKETDQGQIQLPYSRKASAAVRTEASLQKRQS